MKLRENPVYIDHLEGIVMTVSEILGLYDNDLIVSDNVFMDCKEKGMNAFEIMDHVFKSNDVSIEDKFLIFFMMGVTCSESVDAQIKKQDEKLKQKPELN